MLSSTVRRPEAFVDDTGVDPTDLVPLAELAGEGFGWDAPYVSTPLAAIATMAAQLAEDVVLDDLGRRAVSRATARRLIADRAAAEVRWQEARERQDAEHVERAERNRPWAGIPAGYVPDGVSPAAAMLQAAKDAQPRRQSVLQHALSNEGVIQYHPVEQVPE